VAAEGMFGNLNPLGDGPGRSLAVAWPMSLNRIFFLFRGRN